MRAGWRCLASEMPRSDRVFLTALDEQTHAQNALDCGRGPAFPGRGDLPALQGSAGGRAPAARVRRHHLHQPQAGARLLSQGPEAAPARCPSTSSSSTPSGIDPERDLDEAAIALHRMSRPQRPQRAGGLFDGAGGQDYRQAAERLAGRHATSRESYAGHTIYTIPSEGRTVRVAQIGYDMVAVSNTPTPEQIHSMLDRHATAAWPFAGSTLLRAALPRGAAALAGLGRGPDRPALLGWLRGGSGDQNATDGGDPRAARCRWISVLDSLPLIASCGSTAWRWAARCTAEWWRSLPATAAAASQAAALNVLLMLARGFTAPLAGNAANNSLKELLKTAEVTQKRDRVVVTATALAARCSAASTGSHEGAPPDSSSEPGCVQVADSDCDHSGAECASVRPSSSSKR